MRPRETQRREDLAPRGEVPSAASREEVARERGEGVSARGSGASLRSAPGVGGGKELPGEELVREGREGARRGLEFTHVDRVMFPEPGYTKGDVLGYYERVAPYLLPYLRGRPITVERMPEGLEGSRFWQKNTPANYPKWIERVRLPTEQGKEVEYSLVNDVATLLYLVNQGVVTFHSYLSTVDHLDRPDYVVFDLDRGEATFADVVTAARQIHLLLDALRVRSCPKTSGKSGVHVLARWRGDGGYEQARAWAMDIAENAVALSDIATTQRLKAKRGGRVYIDVIQNALGHHVVPPFVLRATAGATVSMPLKWGELKLNLEPGEFNLGSVPERLARGWRDPMGRILG